jgi:hypothetical protein
MKQYTVNDIAGAWVELVRHHLDGFETVMDTNITKSSPITITIKHPERRLPHPSANPFIPFFLSILGMTSEDADPAVIQKWIPEIAGFQDNKGRFSMAMGYRFRSMLEYDQEKMLETGLRGSVQIMPVCITDPSWDVLLQNRPSVLSVVFSLFQGNIQTLVTIDGALMHAEMFHAELSTISLWMEMLSAQMGRPVGEMCVVAAGTVGLQETHAALSNVQPAADSYNTLRVMGVESDPEVLISDFKTWPLVGPGNGYKSYFFRHTVVPMGVALQKLLRENVILSTRKTESLEAAARINDIAWRNCTSDWIRGLS